MDLLVSQKNSLFHCIQQHGFQPAEFQWEESTHTLAGMALRLLHVRSEFWFSFDYYDEREGFGVGYSPGSESLEFHSVPPNWKGVLANFGNWLVFLKREAETPNLWDSLEIDDRLIQDAAGEDLGNTPFTQAELPKVHVALEDIKAYVIKTHELSEAQKKIVDARFDYMEEAATRMGRKDWVNIVISNLLGIVIALALSGDSTRDLFRFAGQVVRQLLGTVLYLAGPH